MANKPMTQDEIKKWRKKFIEEFNTQQEASQREFIGLTDEEINTLAATPAAIPGSYVHSFARAIEAKLREKNT